MLRIDLLALIEKLSTMRPMELNSKPPIGRAIEVAGGITKLARALELSSHTVIYQWSKTRVPAEKCPDIEALTGVKCEELRPDVNWAVLRSKPRKSESEVV